MTTPTVFGRQAIDHDPRNYEVVEVRLPKQWLHWAMLAGLKPASHLRGRWRGFYMKGRNRHWRVNCFGFFEASCPLEHFDRWANSRGAEVRQLPRTRDEFLEAVARLHAVSASAR